MPLYEYKCNECGEDFEKMVRLSETEKAPECPRCGSVYTSKQLSRVASRVISGASAGASSSSCSPSSGSRFS